MKTVTIREVENGFILTLREDEKQFTATECNNEKEFICHNEWELSIRIREIYEEKPMETEKTETIEETDSTKSPTKIMKENSTKILTESVHPIR